MSFEVSNVSRRRKNGSPVVVGVKQSQKAIARDQAAGVLIALMQMNT